MKETQPDKPVFSEWQLPRAATFIPHLMVFPSFWLVFAPLNADFGLILGIFATVFSVWIRFALSKRIVLTDQELIVGKARIPRDVLGKVTVIEKSDQFAEKGPKLDARAYVALKALNGLVKIENTDASDPTPYILVSTRKPEQLRQALTS
jgi:hypothetical protein